MKLITLITLILSILSLVLSTQTLGKPEDADKFAVAKGNDREKKLKEIFWENHWDAISKACSGTAKYIIGGRETGALSIARIAQGAKPKPHTILEKSVKKSSVPDLDKKPWASQLSGFVGHYEKDVLVGLRTDGLKDNPKVKEIEGGSYLTIEDALEYLKTEELQKKNAYMFYTGDYDLHEVYSGNAKLIPEATPEKVTVLNLLNKSIAEVDKKRTGVFKIDKDGLITHDDSVEYKFAMFQHGDQSTYKMNQHLEAKKDDKKQAEVVAAVVNESKDPIGWNVRGKWYVTLNLEEHAALRAAFSLIPPAHWANDKSKGEQGLTYKVTKRRQSQNKLK